MSACFIFRDSNYVFRSLLLFHAYHYFFESLYPYFIFHSLGLSSPIMWPPPSLPALNTYSGLSPRSTTHGPEQFQTPSGYTQDPRPVLRTVRLSYHRGNFVHVPPLSVPPFSLISHSFWVWFCSLTWDLTWHWWLQNVCFPTYT